MNWPEIFVDLAEHYGWTFNDIADMSFDQIRIALGDTKKRRGIPVTSEEEVFAIRRNLRNALGLVKKKG